MVRGMYSITKTKTHTPVTKTNIYVSNFIGVKSSNSVKRPKSKDSKSKNRVLKNTNVKNPSTNAWKVSSSVSIGSNKREAMNSTVCQSNANVLKAKNVNDVNDGSNIVCVSCGKDVFMLSHEKCVTCYALSVDSRVKRTLFTSPVIQLVLWIVNSGCSKHMTDLLTTSHDSNLYTISISELATSSLVCLMSKATSTKSWLWHRILSHLNFSTINHLKKKDLVDGLLKFKFNKDHLCSVYEQGKSKKASFPPKLVPSKESKLELLHMDLCGPMRVASINGKRPIRHLIKRPLPDFEEYVVKMDGPNITMEEYIRLKEEKARRHGKVYNWKTTMCGKIWDNEDVHYLGSVKTEFPAIVFNDTLTSKETLSCEPTVSYLNDEIDFKITFDDSDDEDYTIIFDKNSFSYKITYVNNLKTDSENNNEKVNMPSFPPPEPTAQVLKVWSDNGTEFKNEKLQTFYAKLGITHNTSTIRMPQQNDVVERRNRTLVEAARTILIFSKTLEFFWGEAIATAYFT
ncbi:retrovirus-related pol polyprotein from transposon TNT 1-94 [Tanacetum coccineum]